MKRSRKLAIIKRESFELKLSRSELHYLRRLHTKFQNFLSSGRPPNKQIKLRSKPKSGKFASFKCANLKLKFFRSEVHIPRSLLKKFQNFTTSGRPRKRTSKIRPDSVLGENSSGGYLEFVVSSCFLKFVILHPLLLIYFLVPSISLKFLCFPFSCSLHH